MGHAVLAKPHGTPIRKVLTDLTDEYKLDSKDSAIVRFKTLHHLIRSTVPNLDFQIGVRSAAQYQP